MKPSLTWETYYDKVYGCFLGKCIGGTAGGPAEGRKELLDYPLEESLLHMCLPNDDLDLQILWLELIEDKGYSITARDLAHEFYHKVPYGPGEYAYFQTSYAKGIYPPLSGKYNNRYYKNGMGCPIRSEIWACLFPGADKTRQKYVEMDGCLDHERDSIDAEMFLSTIESELFFSDDIRGAIETAREVIPQDSKLSHMIRDTLGWFDQGYEWQMVRGLILRHYGHADCTNMYQNVGFTLLTLLYGREDFRETIRLGLACGYDTDCICATAASILGIVRGANWLLSQDGFTDTGLNIDVGTRRKTGSIADLARDVCLVGLQNTCFGDTIAITNAPAIEHPIPTEDRTPLIEVRAEYRVDPADEEDPTISPLADSEFMLQLTSHLTGTEDVEITINAPEGIAVTPAKLALTLTPGEVVRLACRAWVLPETKILWQRNMFVVKITGSFGTVEDNFGLAGRDLWTHYGPFIANNKDISHVPPEQYYGGFLPIEDGENGYDVTREFHLGGVADIHRAFANETEPFVDVKPATDDPVHRAAFVPGLVAMPEDRFDTAQVQPYDGPHVDYYVRKLISPEARTVEVAVGHTAPFKLWINGALVGESDKTKWWTLENMHFSVQLCKGENLVILKCAQQSDSAKYSLLWRGDGMRMRQLTDFGNSI